MSMQTTGTTVKRSITVETSVDRAFSVFTDGIASWWDPNHHLLQAEIAEMVFEPRAGGHIIDRGVDGSEDRWARVLAYEPPTRVVFSWDISLEWKREADPAKCSEVEVTFTEQEPGRTLVVLEHKHLDRHGEGWEQMAAAVAAPNGWNLERFGAAAERAG